MKKTPKASNPRLIDGRRGSRVVRSTINGCVWHTHYSEHGRIVGLEGVSGMANWWMDTTIKRTRKLKQGDWDFRAVANAKRWEFQWAWEYERWREWQPWSDFKRWRSDWHKKAKRLLKAPNFFGEPLTKEDAERIAQSQTGYLPPWIMRDFAAYFPNTPWVDIPQSKRDTLKNVKLGSSCSLDGSLLTLKEPDTRSTEGLTDFELSERHREWMFGPGRFQHEVVKTYGPGHYVGTYVIEIPWSHTNENLKQAFAIWLKKEERALPGPRKIFSRTGTLRHYEPLKQLGALRLLRSGMTAEQARDFTKETCGVSLYVRPGEWSEAKMKADKHLARAFGVA
jgi:hypothetical protein